MTTAESIHQCRTVLWIGDRESEEIQLAYQVAEACASQLAYRSSLRAAIQRVASDVDLIIISAGDRGRLNVDDLGELNRRHPSAMRYLFRGSLCRGIRLAGDDIFGRRRCDGIEAAELLRSLLGDQIVPAVDRKVIAVMASQYAAAQPLLDVAECAGCSAVWCQSERMLALRGATHLWWDDSLATPTDVDGWRQRMKAIETKPVGVTPTGHAIQHAWITNRVHWTQIQHAHQAGVASILTKPFSVRQLLATVHDGLPDQHARHQPRSPYARAA